ncbi:PilW family protein [Teredinibacter waterburyi]|jgi:hypothetical protein|uniref:PilW family protein n=1 Tax=Teredinibacter waterburyi TaxID=1500538 RepID=UPI00165F0283|nr:hypothetical protein [Teredinibacter waterburyi]
MEKMFQKQRGASLISLMIGVLVSMLCILGTMVMHKSLIQVSVEAKTDAEHDSRVASAMLRLQLGLQNAGYGIDNAGADDVVVAYSGTTRDLLWRYLDADSGNMTCRGVREVTYTDADSGIAGRNLVKLGASSGCTETATLTDLSWTSGDSIAKFRNQANPIFNFSVGIAACAPYGLGVSENHLIVTVMAPSSAVLANTEEGLNNIDQTSFAFCLTNTRL